MLMLNPFVLYHLSKPIHVQRRSVTSLLIPAVSLTLIYGSCSEVPPDPPPPARVTDTKPVGDGLKVIGYALLGSAIVLVLGSMSRR